MLDTVIKGGTLIDGLGGAPVVGDIGIKDGVIAEIGGNITTAALTTLDASGAIVTPGFVDVHTHYDGQVTWDDEMDPSFSHGVTSVIMGNCGVGFAPVPVGGEKDLIEVMEGVEDIPGTALYEGMPWGAWETFPEYMDFIASREYALDIGAQIAHGAVRNYVMGERGRANDPATPADMDAMSNIVEEALSAGAVGFSTSRTIGHRDMNGKPVPGTFAADEEVLAIAERMRKINRGVFEVIPAGVIGDLEFLGGEAHTIDEEVELLSKVSHTSRRPVTFSLLQAAAAPRDWERVLTSVDHYNAKGATLRPQVGARPVGYVSGLQTYHMFMRRETYLKIAHLPFGARLAEMKKPEVRAAILADKDIRPDNPGPMGEIHKLLARTLARTYAVTTPMDYEPTDDKSFAALAKAAGVEGQEFTYDYFIKGDGKNFAAALGSNYYDATHDPIRAMMTHPDSVSGLSDAGAHVNLIFDGVSPTFQLTHWARDRKRGETLPVEFLVHKQAKVNADLYGLSDRGSLEVGKRADINVIDHKRLSLGDVELFHDLPAGGSRILQPATGYIATFVAGTKTRENDRDTGARPGRLIRGQEFSIAS